MEKETRYKLWGGKDCKKRGGMQSLKGYACYGTVQAPLLLLLHCPIVHYSAKQKKAVHEFSFASFGNRKPKYLSR